MKKEKAILAGGCFWGMQELIRTKTGILSTRVGYTGGDIDHPTYDQVRTGITGHAEAIEIIFDPAMLSFEDILRFFFQIHDPTTKNQQGNDRGSQYRSAIFYVHDTQKEIALDMIDRGNKSAIFPGPIVTEVIKASAFYAAEDNHQDYLQHYPDGYTCHMIRKDWLIPE